MKFSKQNMKPTRTQGVTLIELLVVVAILSVLTAIMIPRLRVINKDRNSREAARIVGSMLSQVSNRAINEGSAGLIIERNPNFVDANGVSFAGVRMYAMRRIPPFTGDDLESPATIVSSNSTSMTISIPRPLEHTATNPLVQVHDLIRLNHNSVRYRVLDVNATPATLILRLALGLKPGYGAIRPTLTTGAEVPYVVYRQPRKLESSRVDLPDGYFIDLRFSGPLVPTDPTAPRERGSVFDLVTPGTVHLYFGGDGGIDRYTFINNGGTAINDVARDAFYFFITAYEPNSTLSPLYSPSNLWVVADHSTGSVNVTDHAMPPTTLSKFNRIQYARGFGKTRQSANQ